MDMEQFIRFSAYGKKYHIFKIESAKGDSDVRYVADGPATSDLLQTDVTDDMKHFAYNLYGEHMDFLGECRCTTERIWTELDFSYEPTYATVLGRNKIYHSKRLTSEEIGEFEKCILEEHNKCWDDIEANRRKTLEHEE